MTCNHEHIKSVNCEIFCMMCGAKLPIDYLVGKERIAEQNKAAKPAEAPAEESKEEPKEEPKEAPKTTKKTTKKGAK